MHAFKKLTYFILLLLKCPHTLLYEFNIFWAYPYTIKHTIWKLNHLYQNIYICHLHLVRFFLNNFKKLSLIGKCDSGPGIDMVRIQFKSTGTSEISERCDVTVSDFPSVYDVWIRERDDNQVTTADVSPSPWYTLGVLLSALPESAHPTTTLNKTQMSSSPSYTWVIQETETDNHWRPRRKQQ